jgi:RNA polymerase sigma factor (sigma-70 family)
MYLRSRRQIEVELDAPEAQKAANVEWADAALDASELLTIVAKLPTGYRTVFNLYAIEGYSHAEIAEQLGITESTSKSQLHRARGLLQEMLQSLETGSRNVGNY